MTKARTRRLPLRLAAALLALVACMPGLGSAHVESAENGFVDTFNTLGPLAGTEPTDPYEIKAGTWHVVDQPKVGGISALGNERVLQQDSRATNVTGDPMVFIRGLKMRSFTAQVTAAFLDTISTGDPAPGSSVGLVFRAPLHDDTADSDNLYLFTSVVTGIATGFPTGKALVLFKRVARGYYLQDQRIIPTWADLTQPHEYKVVVAGGHIQCFFDGHSVIDAVDIPSGDVPTAKDPLPGLPIDAGTVGLRTSGARAVFDNFTVVGNDAYEGRAAAVDAWAQYGQRSSTAADVRRGTAPSLSSTLKSAGANKTDTGFVYHDHDGFDDAIVRPLDNPGAGGGTLGGAELRSTGTGDTVTSVARLLGVNAVFTDPTQRVTVSITASSIETTASASCDGTSSAMNVTNGTMFIQIVNTADGNSQSIGPFPLKNSQAPNTKIAEVPGVLTVIAHAEAATAAPRRVEASAFRIVLNNQSQAIPSQGSGAARTPAIGLDNTPAGEIVIGEVLAGRYCTA